MDRTFSPFKADSETERINRGELAVESSSDEMRFIAALCERTRIETGGYFDGHYNGRLDPSGVVKGHAIEEAAEILRRRGRHDFFIDAGGDIQTSGRNVCGEKWAVGIRNPFMPERLAVVVYLSGEGIATSGGYFRGGHVFDPVHRRAADGIASVTVISRGVCNADRFATAAFAMGESGIDFINSIDGLEGYAIDRDGGALCTRGFQDYLRK